jgi:hypothetical protein
MRMWLLLVRCCSLMGRVLGLGYWFSARATVIIVVSRAGEITWSRGKKWRVRSLQHEDRLLLIRT